MCDELLGEIAAGRKLQPGVLDVEVQGHTKDRGGEVHHESRSRGHTDEHLKTRVA